MAIFTTENIVNGATGGAGLIAGRLLQNFRPGLVAFGEANRVDLTPLVGALGAGAVCGLLKGSVASGMFIGLAGLASGSLVTSLGAPPACFGDGKFCFSGTEIGVAVLGGALGGRAI